MRRQRKSSGFYREMDLLWKEYLKDPSLWHDNRSMKNSDKSPDFRQKITCESLWISGWYNSIWVCEELERRGIVPLTHSTAENHAKGWDFVALLKTCANKRNLYEGVRLHAKLLQRDLLERCPYLPSSLINMYTKCGALTKAQQVFEDLEVQDVISWNALIAGYVLWGHSHEALNCFEQMKSEGLPPNGVTFISIVKACALNIDIDKGKQIHDEIVSRGLLGNDVSIGNALVDMYAKCGVLQIAENVFQGLLVHDTVSWNALLTGYAEHNRIDGALDCFKRMQIEGLSPDAVTFICILKACGSAGAMYKGKLIHNEILSRGLLENDTVLGCALVDMYAKCGGLVQAQKVLEELPERDVASWSAVISGYAEHGKVDEALNCFEQMQKEGLYPDAVTFVCILKACSNERNIDKGKQIHDELRTRGLLEKDIMIGTTLVAMYAKCGMLVEAREVLEGLPTRNIVSWSALIVGYIQQGEVHEALDLFERMQTEGLSPNAITYSCLLKACGMIKATEKGKEIHRKVAREGLLKKDIVLGTALIDMYAKCGMLVKAQQVLEELPERNIITWNALIAGYAQEGQCDEAVDCLKKMQNDNVSPNLVTFLCILKACAIAGAICQGRKIHDEIVSRGLLKNDAVLGNALVDMYVKCSVLARAQQVLEELPERDIVAWNTLIAGYAQQGEGHEALNCFERMQNEGFSPDGVTFLCLLSACMRSGLLEDAQRIFENMTSVYGVIPNVEHQNCMMVGFGCAGHFDKAMSAIKSMSSGDYSAVWFSLLGACKKWGNVTLGNLAFDQAVV